MISRRLIRIKVLTNLYASIHSSKTIENAEKELLFSINKTYELYHHFLRLPIAVVDYAAHQIALGKQKIKPTTEERTPNTKFIDNSFVQTLREHVALQEFAERNHFAWSQEVVKEIYASLKNADYFQTYMQNTGYRSFAEDKMIVIKMLETEVEDRDALYDAIEEQSIYWANDAEYALSHAIKSCRLLMSNEDKLLMPLYKDDADKQFAHRLFRAATANHSQYRQFIEKHTQHWEIDRIAIMDIMIMIVAIAELVTFADIPVSVTLNEYIEIAKYYSTAQSSMFINGILDKIVVDLTEQKLIAKYYEDGIHKRE
jgi:N utilization substance protein B